MNTISSPKVEPRRIGRWLLVGLALLMLPIFVVGIAAASMLRLDGDAAMLRKEVMAATDSEWDTKVQLSVGGVALTAIRTGLRFVQQENIEDARLALSAVRRASVGVYEGGGKVENSGELFARLDKKMKRDGWSRLVGVVDDDATVMIYASDAVAAGKRIELCLAMLDGKQLVVVSTQVEAAALSELVARHAPGDLGKELKLAQLSF